MSSTISMSTATEVAEQHHALRHDCGLIEWPGAGVFDVAGPEAADFLDEVCTRSVAFLFEERTLAALLLDDDGTVLAIVDLLCRGDSFTVLVWPDQRLVAWTRLAEKAQGRHGVTLSDHSASTAVLAVEGPRAGAAVAPFVDGGIGQIAYRSFTVGRWEESEVLVARIGVTAEFGYTLILPSQHGDSLRSRLVDTGVHACGREAVDVCRMESRFVNLERECPHRRTTPFELGLQWMIDFTHGFAARDALLGRWDSEVTRLPVCFTAPGEAPAHPGVEVLLDGQVVGSVTHAVWSPALGHVVGVAHLDRDVAVPGLPLSTRGARGATPIVTCSGPFLVPTSVAGLRR